MSQALVDAIVAIVDARIAAHNSGATVAAGNSVVTAQPTPAAATPAADPFGLGTTAGTVAPAIEVTPKMVQELVIPLISNDVAKARFGEAMRSMGITELPAARPDQLPELYAKFKAIADEVNGAAATPATTGGVTLI